VDSCNHAIRWLCDSVVMDLLLGLFMDAVFEEQMGWLGPDRSVLFNWCHGLFIMNLIINQLVSLVGFT